MINCIICNDIIVKYKLDLGDTVCLMPPGKTEFVYVCEECSHNIALQRISR